MNRADQLEITFNDTEDSNISFFYLIDREISGKLSIQLPSQESISSQSISLLGAGVGVFLAQLCLSREVILNFPVPVEIVDLFKPLCKLLYDVRAYTDKIKPIELPEIIFQKSKLEPGIENNLNDKHAVLLWGGGKDSTYSQILLDANGYTTTPIHFSANYRSEQSEKKAVQSLASHFGLTPIFIDFQFPDMLVLGKKYSNAFDIYPSKNAIPHGRDMVLTLVSAIFAVQRNAGVVCFGHEADLWNKKIKYYNTVVHRHNTQSEAANVLLQDVINLVHPTLKIFSPIAPLTEFLILHNLLNYYPAIAANINSCFWGDWCGECSKCLRYSLIQEVVGKSFFSFDNEPLDDDNDILWQTIKSLGNKDLPYRDEIFYCLTIVSQKDKDNDIWRQAREYFDENVVPKYQEEIPDIKFRLTKIYKCKLLPKDFNVQLDRGK